MRTTIVIEDSLEGRLKGLASRKGLSEFINHCIREHFAIAERKNRLQKLEKAYARVSKAKGLGDDFDAVNLEDWPEW